jgi:hypothetical protein
MHETPDVDAVTRRVAAVTTVVLYGGVLSAAYVWGRFYRRWSKENHLLASPRARVDRFKTDYKSKKANTTEMAGIFGGMLVEIVTASAKELRK